jgi:hypothetical protein
MDWKAGKITSLKIHSNADGKLRLIPRAGQGIGTIRIQNGATVSTNADIFAMKSGNTYEVTFR